MIQGLKIKKIFPEISEQSLPCFLSFADFKYSTKENEGKEKDFSAKVNYTIFSSAEVYEYSKAIAYFASEYCKIHANAEKLYSLQTKNYLKKILDEFNEYVYIWEIKEVEIILSKKITEFTLSNGDLEKDIFDYLSKNPSVFGGEFVEHYVSSEEKVYDKLIAEHVDYIDKLDAQIKKEYEEWQKKLKEQEKEKAKKAEEENTEEESTK